MDTHLSLLSPAKLNLFLHINGRRPDGYHELQTLFQILDYGDTMHFAPDQSGQIRVSPELEGVPTKDNLIYRAAKLLQTHTKTDLGASIRIEKVLPMGGGLGGGSSNAATTLLALNKLWQLNLSQASLAELGLSLGADIPVFIHGQSALAEGVGERLQAVDLDELWYVILHPRCHVSTAEIFSSERLTRDTPKIKIAPALGGLGPDTGHNDCEAIASELYPEIRDAIAFLNQFGTGRLTGTGACCFCQTESQAKAQKILEQAQPEFEGFVAKGVNISPTLQGLREAD